MRRCGLAGVCLLLAGAVGGHATTITISGNFNQDDDVQLFYYSVSGNADVTVRTTSYALGGFQTILTLFNPAHVFEYDNTGNGSATDAELPPWNSDSGALYIVALTQYDNFAAGSTLEDGFQRDGQGNFTAESPFNNPVPGGSFLEETTGIQKSSFWSVEFSSTDPGLVAFVPEPSTFGLFACGAALGAYLRRVRKAS